MTTPAFDDILQDAVGMVGGGPVLAEELSSAMRGLNQLLVDLQNKNLLLHKIDVTVVPVSTATVTLDPSWLDVQTVNCEDVELQRLGFKSWANLPTTGEARPTQYWFDRQASQGVINVWPTPDTQYDLTVWGQRHADMLTRAYDFVDIPKRFWPAVTFGLAYWIGLRRPRVDAQKLALIKAEYVEKLKAAMQEDRERSSFMIRLGHGR
jgi:hypothetical protein